MSFGTIVRAVSGQLPTRFQGLFLPLSEVVDRPVERSQSRPRADWRFLSTGAQLRAAGDYRAPIAPDRQPCYWCDPDHGPCRIHDERAGDITPAIANAGYPVVASIATPAIHPYSEAEYLGAAATREANRADRATFGFDDPATRRRVHRAFDRTSPVITESELRALGGDR